VIERTIIERLQSVNVEAAHPLLLPGIFAELELARHIRLVDMCINDVEAKIFELNFISGSTQYYHRSEVEKRSESKRTAWLDLSYLRNSLITWNTQLLKMVEHADSLSKEEYSVSCLADALPRDEGVEFTCLPMHAQLEAKISPLKSQKDQVCKTCPPRYRTQDFEDIEEIESNESYISDYSESKSADIYLQQMRKTGEKIRVRLAAIRDEYDEKIRDCTMRVDGMAMATQWVNLLNEAAYHLANLCSRKAKPL
jgi:hypothetical protein